MAWNTPTTWAAGAVLTAAQMNAQIRDNLAEIGGAWTAYTPTLTVWGLGNGTISGRRSLAGKFVNFRILLTVGSTTTFGSDPSFSLPATAFATGSQNPSVGRFSFYDVSSGARRYYEAVLNATATGVSPLYVDGSSVTSTVPWAWAAGDLVEVRGTYEAA